MYSTDATPINIKYTVHLPLSTCTNMWDMLRLNIFVVNVYIFSAPSNQYSIPGLLTEKNTNIRKFRMQDRGKC